MSIENNNEFRPKIVAFCCNWCSYAGADLAGSSRLAYPADVKIIKVPCSCRVNPMFILRAFEKGADGVKHVKEKSWLSRGNKVIITGIRRDSDFIAKKYKNTPHHLVELITSIDENGYIQTKQEREVV